MKNEKLFSLLSCYVALESKVRNYHWNVECHHFTEYHKYFEEEYEVLSGEIDRIAEQIRKLGEKVPFNLENVVNYCKKTGLNIANDAERSVDMVLCLLESNKQIIEMIKDLISEFEGNRDYISTIGLLDDLLESREKDAWFLTSLSK